MFFKEEYIENYDFSLNKFTLINIVDNFLEITLNRNEKKNALSTEMIKELAVCTDYANTKNEIRGVIYKSSGDTFCAGLDLKNLKTNEDIFLGDVFNKLEKPKLAVIEGNVYGGGLLFLSCSDFIIAKKDLIFSLTETKRGLFPYQIMHSFSMVMPPKIALKLCVHASTFNSEEAKKYNLIDFITDDIELQIREWKKSINQGSPNAINSGIKVFNKLYHNNDTIAYLNKELDLLKESDDAKEGIKAFIEKRDPKWK
jgi:methylglutaconyl-CoA hydratase